MRQARALTPRQAMKVEEHFMRIRKLCADERTADALVYSIASEWFPPPAHGDAGGVDWKAMLRDAFRALAMGGPLVLTPEEMTSLCESAQHGENLLLTGYAPADVLANLRDGVPLPALPSFSLEEAARRIQRAVEGKEPGAVRFSLYGRPPKEQRP